MLASTMMLEPRALVVPFLSAMDRAFSTEYSLSFASDDQQLLVYSSLLQDMTSVL